MYTLRCHIVLSLLALIFLITACQQSNPDQLDSPPEIYNPDIDIETTASTDDKADLGNRVWLDDGDGIKQTQENGFRGINVKLWTDKNNDGSIIGETLMAEQTTDAGGFYRFNALDPDINYVLQIIAPTGFIFSPKANSLASTPDRDSDINLNGLSDSLDLERGKYNYFVDAALKADGGTPPEPIKLSRLGNRIWDDTNGDGIKQYNERGFKDIKVNLWIDTDKDNTPDSILKTDTTDSGGFYFFNALDSAQQYFLQVDLPNGYIPSPKNNPQAQDKDRDSDLNSDGISDPLNLFPLRYTYWIDGGLVKGSETPSTNQETLIQPPPDGRNVFNLGPNFGFGWRVFFDQNYLYGVSAFDKMYVFQETTSAWIQVGSVDFSNNGPCFDYTIAQMPGPWVIFPKLHDNLLVTNCEGSLVFLKGSGVDWQFHSSFNFREILMFYGGLDRDEIRYDFSDDRLFLVDPRQDSSQVYAFRRNGIQWQNQQIIESGNISDVQINTSSDMLQLAISSLNPQGNQATVNIYDVNDNTYELQNTLSIDLETSYSATNIVFEEDTLVVYTLKDGKFDPIRPDLTDQLFIYTRQDNIWSGPQTIKLDPIILPRRGGGIRDAILKKNHLLLGFDSKSTGHSAELYEYSNGLWSLKQVFEQTREGSGSRSVLGFSIALSDTQIALGEEFEDRTNTPIHIYKLE